MLGQGVTRKKVEVPAWEEAGSEFYQENYFAEAESVDVFTKDEQPLSTLLPSQQNRSANARTLAKKTLRHSKKPTSRRESYTSNKRHVVQVCALPDLSESISNEQNIWEEIKQVKGMPIPMAQKREIRFKIMNEPNLKLQGFEQFKWKKLKLWRKIIFQIMESCQKLELWRSDLKHIEGHFGTGIVSYFLFLRWLFFINLFIFFLILFVISLPTAILYKYDQSHCNEGSNVILDLVQGTGFLQCSLMFYGSYPNINFKHEVFSNELHYDIPFAYLSVVIIYFIVCLLIIVKAGARGFKVKLIEGEGHFYLYCNMILVGWDFCIQNNTSSTIKNASIYLEIKNAIKIIKSEIKRQSMSRNAKYKLLLIRIMVNVAVFSILTLSAYCIYEIFQVSSTKLKETKIKDSVVEQLIYRFLPSFTIICLTIWIPLLFKHLIKFEQYKQSVVLRITLIRTVFFRLAALLVFYSNLYYEITCLSCNLQCWETYVGQEIYKLFLTDFATNFLVIFFINYPRAVMARHIHKKYIKFLGEQTFDLPKHVLDVVYSQTLVWLGCFFAPFLSGFAILFCILTFYMKKFVCLVNSKPSVTIYRASKSKSMFMIVLLISYFVALLPIVFIFSELKPSQLCGPFRNYLFTWQIIFEFFKTIPPLIRTSVLFVITPSFIVPLVIVLVLCLYYYSAINSANRHMVMVLKNQLILEGHDKQFLLDRLGQFMNQQEKRVIKDTNVFKNSAEHKQSEN